MSKIKSYLLISLFIVDIIVIILFITFVSIFHINGVYINGVYVGSMTYEDSYDALTEAYINPISVICSGKSYMFDCSGMFISSNIVYPTTITEYVFSGDYHRDIIIEDINEEYHKEWIRSLGIDTIYPILYYDDKVCLTDYIYGYSVDEDKAYTMIINAMEDRKEYVDISTCIVPDREGSAYINDMIDMCNSLCWINDFYIQIQDESGNTYETINGEDIFYRCLNPYDLSVVADIDYVREVVYSAVECFSSSDDNIKFSTTYGDEIVVPVKTLTLDYLPDVSVNNICFGIETRNTKTHKEVIHKSDNNGIGSEYIEISIENQHLYYYKGNSLIMDTDIVTGHYGKHDTPIGVYYVTEMIKGKTLRGEGYATWVDRWMRLTNSGIGLHDASWRNKFGNDTYKHNGSHGCINLPKSFAYSLFSEITIGVPVIIY